MVTISTIIEVKSLPEGTTSQKAELIALTRALNLSKDQRVNVYTDSKYAFLIAHSHSALWRERGLLTTKGSPVVNASLIAKLLEALQLPKEVAIIHCRGHQLPSNPIAQGNSKADSVARELTKGGPPAPLLFFTSPTQPT